MEVKFNISDWKFKAGDIVDYHGTPVMVDSTRMEGSWASIITPVNEAISTYKVSRAYYRVSVANQGIAIAGKNILEACEKLSEQTGGWEPMNLVQMLKRGCDNCRKYRPSDDGVDKDFTCPECGTRWTWGISGWVATKESTGSPGAIVKGKFAEERFKKMDEKAAGVLEEQCESTTD